MVIPTKVDLDIFQDNQLKRDHKYSKISSWKRMREKKGKGKIKKI